MTQAEKTEIENLLASAGAMKHLAKEMNAPYNDAKIAEYAVAALEDAKETKAYVLSVLNDNIGMFIDLNNIIVRRSFGGDEINYLIQNGTFNHKIGDLLKIKLRVNDIDFSKLSPCSDGVRFSVTPQGIEVLDAWIYTSDTSLTAKDFGYDETIYHYFACTCDLYFGAYGRRSSDYVQQFDPKGKYTAKFWNHLRNCAERTRAKGDILLKELKRQISLVVAAYKAEAEKIEGFRDANANVGTYAKIR